ncbi:MAG: nuclear transport factor 2 family protein [Planctomycetota bacterium]
MVARAMNALFAEYSAEGVSALFSEGYVQHNPNVRTGREPILGLLPALREAGFGYTLHRAIEDGDLVVTHTTCHNADFFGAKEVVAFDVWRVEDGKVAEHWDSIQPLAAHTASGRSQTDGVTEVVDLDRTEQNKELVRGFVRDILIGADRTAWDGYIRDGRYAQHNPMVEDGPDALRAALESLRMKEVRRVIGEGNFVLTQSRAEWDERPFVFYDLFRVEDGAIVEHWDVLQEIPEEMAHPNGML